MDRIHKIILISIISIGAISWTVSKYIYDEKPMLIHTGPIGMYKKIEEKVREVIPLQKLAYVAFLHFESDCFLQIIVYLINTPA